VKTRRFRITCSLAMAAAVAVASHASAADLPKATQAILAKGKLDSSVLTGLDGELSVPAAWFAAAKKEPELKVLASWDPGQFRDLSAPFRERYPDLKVQYNRGGTYDRGIKTLVAYNDGRTIADIVGSTSNAWIKLKEIGGLTDLSDLPNYKLLADGRHDPDGVWVGQKLAYRCIAYNTTKIKAADLPKTWDDLVTNPVWRNGTLAMPDVPDVWVAMLWDAKGPQWTTNFLTKLFKEVKPQLRKEGTSAGVSLTAAGETPAFIGAADYRVMQSARKGAPISWHCPEPVPAAISQLMVLKGSPAPYRAKIFLNWFLSREGQVAQYVTDFSTPVHKDLEHDRHFLPYPDEIIGKDVALRDEVKMQTMYDQMTAVYVPLWTGAGGAFHEKDKEE